MDCNETNKEECFMKLDKNTAMKLLGIGGTLLGVAATVMSNMSQQNEMKATVAKEVAKALAEKGNN